MKRFVFVFGCSAAFVAGAVVALMVRLFGSSLPASPTATDARLLDRACVVQELYDRGAPWSDQEVEDAVRHCINENSALGRYWCGYAAESQSGEGSNIESARLRGAI